MIARTLILAAGLAAGTIALTGCGQSYSLASGPQYRAPPAGQPTPLERRVEAHRTYLRTMDRSPVPSDPAD